MATANYPPLRSPAYFSRAETLVSSTDAATNVLSLTIGVTMPMPTPVITTGVAINAASAACNNDKDDLAWVSKTTCYQPFVDTQC